MIKAKAATKKTTATKAAPKTKEAKPAPKAAAKAVAEAHPLLGRSKEAGCKIVILDKAADRTRDGSKNAMFFQYITDSKTTDEAVVKIRAHMSKPWDVIRMAVARGYIKLEPTDGSKKAATKPAPAKPAPAKPAPKTAAKVKAEKETKPVGEKKKRAAGRRASDEAARAVAAQVAELSAQAALGSVNAMVAAITQR